MSDYGKLRKELLMHDATYLLTHEPICDDYLNWRSQNYYNFKLSTEGTLKVTFVLSTKLRG